MNLEIILIAMFAAFLIFALVIFCAFMALKKTMDDAIGYMKSYTDIITELYQRSHKYEESLSEDMLRYAEKCDQQNEMYGKFLEASEAMLSQYKKIESAYKKLLDCWKGIDERYDQTYEQFKLAVNKLDELHLKIEDLSCLTTKDEYRLTLNAACDTVCLDCPYENCLNENCPVYTVMHRDTPEKTARVCDLNDYYNCPYKECVRKDCPIFVEKSVTTPGFDDPLLGR